VKTLTIVGIAAFALAGVAGAAQQANTWKLAATLKASSEVPKPTDVRAGATGTFTGTAVEQANAGAKLSWQLKFSKLTGSGVAAHIHIGKSGKAGNVMVALCGPCKTGKRRTAAVTKAQLKTIRAGGTYVNVHTKKNPAGEIRGQVKAKKGASTSGTPPPPSPPPPPGDEPPPDPYP